MKALTNAQRAQIWQFHLLGVSKTKIGERLGIHRNTVALAIKKDTQAQKK